MDDCVKDRLVGRKVSDIQRKVTFNCHCTDLHLVSSASINEGPTLMQARIGFGVAWRGNIGILDWRSTLI
jgi:hypothetical protein